jgi:hypothetical protein
MTAVNDPAFDSLLKIFHGEIQELTTHVAAGGCKDIEEYRHVCGQITGLMTAERELADLDERLLHR